MEDKQTTEDLSTNVDMKEEDLSEEECTTKDRRSSIDRLNQLKVENHLTFARQILEQFQSNSRRSSSDNQHFLTQFKVYVQENLLAKIFLLVFSGM